MNVPQERPQALQGWVSFLTSIGYRVFARPRVEGSDIDDDMLGYVREMTALGAKEVVIGSNDGRMFLEPVREIVAAGTRVVVVGFTEFAGELAEPDAWEFVDLDDIPELLSVPLPRTRLDRLSADGGWLEPRVTIDEAIGSSGHERDEYLDGSDRGVG